MSQRFQMDIIRCSAVAALRARERASEYQRYPERARESQRDPEREPESQRAREPES